MFFDDAKFLGETHFEKAIFDKSTSNLERSISFVNVTITGETSFEGAKFLTKPPRFFNAKLRQGTVWPPCKDWPIPKKGDDPKEFVRAYERLKLEMDGLKKHEDELNFFALELRSRRVVLGPFFGFPITLYGFFSGYGRSWLRPLLALVGAAAFGAAIFRHFGGLTLGEASGLSLANIFNIFGFRRDFIETSVVCRLSNGLKALAAFQTVVGAIERTRCARAAAGFMVASHADIVR